MQRYYTRNSPRVRHQLQIGGPDGAECVSVQFVPLTASLQTRFESAGVDQTNTRPGQGMGILHQMVHEGLQRNIVCEDGLGGRRSSAAVRACRVGRRWIQLGQQEPGLRAASIAYDKARQREAVRNEILYPVSVVQWKSCLGTIPWHLPSVAPTTPQNSRSLPDPDIRPCAIRQSSHRER